MRSDFSYNNGGWLEINVKWSKTIQCKERNFIVRLPLKLEEASLPVKDVSSHSFRRGGATWALTCQIPGEIVKYMGDWKSSVNLSYLDKLPSHIIDHYRSPFVKNCQDKFIFFSLWYWAVLGELWVRFCVTLCKLR